MTDTDVIERTEQKVKLKKPSRWAIVIHNDDTTPMEFVVQLLHHVFNMKIDTATELMLKVHNEGKGIVGVFSHEIAEQKFAEAQALIRISSMQLKVTMEKE